MTESEEKYGDILDLPHHVSKIHPQMSIYDRAAQFSPFAALTGHEAAIKETARLTEQKMELNEDKKEELDEKLQELLAYAAGHPAEYPLVTVTYFVPDKKKEGGRYCEKNGNVKRIDAMEHAIFFTDGTKIEMNRVIELQGSFSE